MFSVIKQKKYKSLYLNTHPSPFFLFLQKNFITESSQFQILTNFIANLNSVNM